MRPILKNFTFTCLLLVFAFLDFLTSMGAEPESRAEFAKAAKQLKRGMSEMQVRTVLGPPDKIHTQDFGTKSSFPEVVSIWFYGTTGRNGFPSWGRVYFSQEPFVQGQESHPKVFVIYGGEGTPPRGFAERDLKNLLSVIADIPRLDWRSFDPQPLIVACNALQPLGKRKVIAVIEEYLRVSPDTQIENVERICILLRVLSEIPADSEFIPPPEIGEFTPPAPADLRQVPRFPILMVRDIPFLVTSGYITGGVPPNLTEELKRFRDKGELRNALLQPAELPVKSSDWLAEIPAWSLDKEIEGYLKAAMKLQWLRLLAHNRSLNLTLPESLKLLTGDWSDTLKQLNRIAGDRNTFRWDSEKYYYVIEK